MADPTLLAERRVAARVAAERAVTVIAGGREHAARTVNISTSGMLVTLDEPLTIWAEVTLLLPGLSEGGLGERGARVVRRDGDSYGLLLREPLSAADFTALTGVEPAPSVDDAVQIPPKPARRTAPWAFGRDRFKTLKREAAERAAPIKR